MLLQACPSTVGKIIVMQWISRSSGRRRLNDCRRPLDIRGGLRWLSCAVDAARGSLTADTGVRAGLPCEWQPRRGVRRYS